ncbi:hypothetical protein K502DRAFT_194410 [Neoconidiobolus thromboides FSU 785]|nr:hypothetical protein K502DRAFT_194410 [Neoconidiobolus thromboides FSU 785]
MLYSFRLLFILFFFLLEALSICRRCNVTGRGCFRDWDCWNACHQYAVSPRWGINGDCDWGKCCCGRDC